MIIREGKTSNNKVLISSDLYFFSGEGVNIVSGERTTDDLDTSFNWDFIRGIHPAVFNMSLNDGKKLTRMDTLANSKKRTQVSTLQHLTMIFLLKKSQMIIK